MLTKKLIIFFSHRVFQKEACWILSYPPSLFNLSNINDLGFTLFFYFNNFHECGVFFFFLILVASPLATIETPRFHTEALDAVHIIFHWTFWPPPPRCNVTAPASNVACPSDVTNQMVAARRPIDVRCYPDRLFSYQQQMSSGRIIGCHLRLRPPDNRAKLPWWYTMMHAWWTKLIKIISN